MVDTPSRQGHNRPTLRLEHVSFAYGNRPAVREIDLTLAPGSFFTLLGPSGCGKTTLLKLIGGYLIPASGSIQVDEVEITRWPPEKRGMGMVFQQYALFPHLSARGNVSFPLEARSLARHERQRRVEAILDLVDLEPALRDRFPHQLSGGQQQRVALARALVFEPRLLLLDEPLANLDRNLRAQFRVELRALQRRTGVTTLMVTHDQDEAMALSDQMAVMDQGRILQQGPPRQLYEQPKSAFIARFLGEANLLPAWQALGKHQDNKPDILMIRPERVLCGREAESCPVSYVAHLESILYLGADSLLTWKLASGTEVRSLTRGPAPCQIGQTDRIGWPSEALWVLPDSPRVTP